MIWCLHGNVGLAADWDILSQHADSPFRGEVIRKVDLWRYQECRSIGLKEFGEIFSSEVSAQDAEPTLVAYSMGGRLALHALLAQSSLWKRVILMSCHPGLRSEEEKVQRRVSDAEWSAKVLKGEWSAFLREWNGQAVLGAVEASLPDRHLLQPRSLSVARAFNAWSLGTQEDMRHVNVDCPVTLISGEEDVKYTELMSEFSFEDSRHIRIKGTGHRTLWENPAETFKQLVS